MEATDVAGNFVPGFEAEGDEGDEAEGEPFPSLRHFAREIACWVISLADKGGAWDVEVVWMLTAVLTLYGDVFIAFQ